MDSRGGPSREDSRRGVNDRGRGGGGGGGGRRAPVDTAPALEDCEPIKINEATRWKPKSLEGKDASRPGGSGPSKEDLDAAKMSVEEVLMKAKAILNKVCYVSELDFLGWVSFFVFVADLGGVLGCNGLIPIDRWMYRQVKNELLDKVWIWIR